MLYRQDPDSSIVSVDSLQQIVQRPVESVGALLDSVYTYLPKVLSALLILIAFWLIYRALRAIVRRTFRERNNPGLAQLIQRLIWLATMSFALVAILAQFNVNVTTLVTGLGIAGIAVGFAARDVIENFIAGIVILFDQPFRVGDNVEIADSFGEVLEITLRSTRLRTPNNHIAIVPNSKMISEKVINHSKLGVFRIEIPFGIAYKEYPQEARKVVLKLTQDDHRLATGHPPKVMVTTMNESSVDMVLRIWIADPRLEISIREDYTEHIREALRKADIEIPFPHLQVFMENSDTET